jgi:apolipoprotein N-acyltransferase
MLVVLGYGIVRLGESGPRQSVKVGLIVADSDVADTGADAERLLKAYALQASDLAARGAQIVVMPEKIAAVRDGDDPVDDVIFQSVANSSGVMIVAGELQLSPGGPGTRRYNRAKVFRPGIAVARYDKEHMLPPFESNLTPGTEKLALSLGATRLGVAICKDMDFTSMGLAYADLGAEVMLVPAWDFNADRTWHGHMAIMRGVEEGFSVVRAAKSGYLTVSDDRGRVVAEVRSDSAPFATAPFATLIADVPVGRVGTLFQRWGNWFAWVAVGSLAGVLVRLAGLPRAAQVMHGRSVRQG